MDERGHHFEEGADKRLRCTRCLREWRVLRRSWRWCPGVPWYVPGRPPEHLYTFTQLKRQGLKPRDRRKRAGYIVTEFHNGVSLYDIREALPRRGAKPSGSAKRAWRPGRASRRNTRVSIVALCRSRWLTSSTR